ncbi:MAG: HYR domain-containing protein [Lewinellaceae bacterium]|nr:HYR domain-containing protein [Lewinellaceae bacterium]
MLRRHSATTARCYHHVGERPAERLVLPRVTTNIWRVTDASGNSATCSFTVTVNDTQNPTITCPANIVRNNDLNQCGAIVTYTTPTFSDNCPGATIVLVSGLPSGSFFPVGITTNVWKVTDASGNMATCSFTVRVNDTQAPVFNNCPGNITQVNDPGVCGAVVTWPKITASDNCPGVVVSFVSGMASGSLFAVGSTTVVYKATDASGNMATCSFVVTVVDNEDPAITCPADIQKNNDYNKCSAAIAFIGTATATDNCGVSGITNNGIGTYPVGVTTVTWTAADGHGNNATCQQTITVVDAQYPVAICPDDIYTVNDPNLPCQAAVTYTTSATDNCPGVVKEVSEWPHSENGLFSIGTTMVMVTATDAAGNQDMCTFNVIVEQAPEICNGLDDDCDGLVDETDDAWRQTDKTVASDGGKSDLFGTSVAMFGDYAVVGAKNSDINGVASGAVYVLKNNASNTDKWDEVAILHPAQVQSSDLFGASVAIASNLIVVGAPQDDDLGADAGAAYVFVKNASDNWDMVKKLTAVNGFTGDNFGTTVAISGDNILVGAVYDDEKGANAGAAYLFSKDQGGAGNWGQLVKITAADGQAGDKFGASIDIDMSTAVIGANLDDDKGVNSGSAYVFAQDQGGANVWGQVKKLTANDGIQFDNFGVSVGINGEFIIIGANQNDDYGSNSGSAYIFERNFGGTTNSWGQAAKLLALDGTSSDELGIAVVINGNYAVAGARHENTKGAKAGAAYVWEHQQDGTWAYVAKLFDAQGDKNDQFGTVLDVYKRSIIIGALNDDVAGKDDQGTVSFFTAGCKDQAFGNPADGFINENGAQLVDFGVKTFPQPFSDVLNIEISMKKTSNVRVVIWNAYGQEVATVFNGALEGTSIQKWDATRFASGTYFLRVEADDKTEVRPIVLVR